MRAATRYPTGSAAVALRLALRCCSSAEATPHPKFKTEICLHWKAHGDCSYGKERCNFAHGEDDLLKPNDSRLHKDGRIRHSSTGSNGNGPPAKGKHAASHQHSGSSTGEPEHMAGPQVRCCGSEKGIHDTAERRGARACRRCQGRGPRRSAKHHIAAGRIGAARVPGCVSQRAERIFPARQ